LPKLLEAKTVAISNQSTATLRVAKIKIVNG